MCFSRTVSALLPASFAAVRAVAQCDEQPPVRLEATYTWSSVFRGMERAGDSLPGGA
jgi:hypothetical protein